MNPHFTLHPLPHSQERYHKLRHLRQADRVDVPLDGVLGPFALTWNRNGGEGALCIQETVYAKIVPSYAPQWRDKPKPVVMIRKGVPEDAAQKIIQIIEDAAKTAAEVKKRVDVLNREARLNAVPVPPAPPVPLTLYEMLFSTDDDAVQEMTFEAPIGFVMKAISGLAAAHESAEIITNTGHTGQEIRLRVRGKFIGDLDFSLTRTDVNTETVTVRTDPTNRRNIVPDALMTQMRTAAISFERHVDMMGLIGAVADISAQQPLDVYTVTEKTSHVRSMRAEKHTETFGDIQAVGMGMSYSIELRYNGFPFARVLTKQEATSSGSHLVILSDDITPQLSMYLGRDLATQIDMRWRCGAAGLDPDAFPAFTSNIGALI